MELGQTKTTYSTFSAAPPAASSSSHGRSLQQHAAEERRREACEQTALEAAQIRCHLDGGDAVRNLMNKILIITIVRWLGVVSL